MEDNRPWASALTADFPLSSSPVFSVTLLLILTANADLFSDLQLTVDVTA